MRKKFPKRDYSNFDAAFDELDRATKSMEGKLGEKTYGDMSDEQAKAIKDRLARLSGAPRAGKNHPQYDQFKNKKPISIGPAKGPGMAKGPGTMSVQKTAINPVTAKYAKQAYPGKPVEKVIKFFKNKFRKKKIPVTQLDAYFKAVIAKNKSNE